MSVRLFDSVTRQAVAVVSRRSSLLTIGGAALAAVATSPGIGEAKKKKNKNKCKKKEQQRCNNDTEACLDTVAAECADSPDPEACAAPVIPCCETCSADGFLTCFLAALAP